MRNRPRHWRSILATLIVASTVLALAGCAQEGPEEVNGPEDSKYGGTAVFRIHGEVATMNPLYSVDNVAGLISAFTSSGLVRRDTQGKWVGALASDWTISDDGLTYTFNLRENAKWHDGEPITADDVMFAYNLIMDEKAAISSRVYQFINGKPITYEKVNDYQVKMILPEKYAPVLTYVVTPLPKHILEKVALEDLPTCEWGEKPILAGPFKLEEYKAGEYLRFVRHDGYWGGKPYLDEVIFRIIPDANSAAVALETGEIDFLDAAPDVFKRMKESGKYGTFQASSGNVQFLAMNNKLFPFNDLKVRQAISCLINRKAIAEQVFLGLAQPAYGFMVPSDMFYNENAIVKHEYNVEKAKQLLAEAGYKPDGDGVLAKDGRRLEFECLYMQGNVQREQAGVVMQADMAKAGIKMNIKAVEWSSQISVLNANTDPLPYESMIIGNTLGPDPDRYSIVYAGWAYPSGGPGSNYFAYIEPEVDELFANGQKETDDTKRQLIYDELQSIISADCPVGYLWYAETLYCYSSRLKTDEAELTGLAHIRVLNPAGLYVTD